MTHQRQLVRQRADGRLYAVPYTPRGPMPNAARYRAAEPAPQPADGPLNGAQPDARARRGRGQRALSDALRCARFAPTIGKASGS
jgi:hypothetical protein